MLSRIGFALATVCAAAGAAEAGSVVLADGLVAVEVPSLSSWAQVVLVGVMTVMGVWMWRGRSSG